MVDCNAILMFFSIMIIIKIIS